MNMNTELDATGGMMPSLTKDPVMNQLDVVQKALDDLRGMLGESEVEPEVEMGPQTDEEIVAGIPPEPKKPNEPPRVS